MTTNPLQENGSETMQPDPEGEARVTDMAPLIGRVREILEQRKGQSFTHTDPLGPEILSQSYGFKEKRGGRAEVVLSEDVARELGHPSTASRAVLLVTFDPALVRNGNMTIVGPDVNEIQERGHHPLAQVVLLAVSQERIPDPFALENAQYLMNRLPGYMVRSVPGKLWVRFSKKALQEGVTLRTVGSALMAAYNGDFEGVLATEVVFITSSPQDVEALDLVASEADILSGRHKKLVLGVDGEVECLELNCETCDEKPVCDDLRDIVIKHRAKRNT